ncbi:MAG TPA: chromate efflux transporter [Rhizomicrobium sp.]|nr:chromate efflux transporter [Rhizomicrobium sp.]
MGLTLVNSSIKTSRHHSKRSTLEKRVPTPEVSAKEAIQTWARIALLSFGGPAGQIAVMHRLLVEEKRWISEARFLHALNYCMLLPGPEAHQLAVYIGWLMHRMRGGIVAGVLFVLPGLIALGALSWIYAAYGQVTFVSAIFFGIKAVVLAIVLDALVRIGRRALKSRLLAGIAATAFIGIFLFALPFPLIVLLAGIFGYASQTWAPSLFKPAAHGTGKTGGGESALLDAQFAISIPEHVRPSLRRSIRIAAFGLALWFAPLLALMLVAGPSNVFTAIAAFNSKMAVVTFGGAYAVLSYMAQQAVEHFHWLKPDEMLVGLGFAESTPGPLISVVQFVGFMAAFRQSSMLDPMLAGTLGGLLAMWCTFVPSFLWIFLGGPYVEALIGNKALNAALSAITAAVVGVILNLATWLALHTLFGTVMHIERFGLALNLPVLSSVDWPAAALALAATIAIFRFRLGIMTVLAAGCIAGLLMHFAGLL